MPAPPRTWTEEQVEAIVGTLLRVGVMLAAVVVCLGGAFYLSRHGSSVPLYGVFHGEPTDLRSVSGIVTDALSLQGRGIIQLGLLLLVATRWRGWPSPPLPLHASAIAPTSWSP
jgi:uncharacterized membrane protein